MDRRAWWATVPGVAKSRTRLGDFTEVLTEGKDLMYSQSISPVLKLTIKYSTIFTPKIYTKILV